MWIVDANWCLIQYNLTYQALSVGLKFSGNWDPGKCPRTPDDKPTNRNRELFDKSVFSFSVFHNFSSIPIMYTWLTNSTHRTNFYPT